MWGRAETKKGNATKSVSESSNEKKKLQRKEIVVTKGSVATETKSSHTRETCAEKEET